MHRVLRHTFPGPRRSPSCWSSWVRESYSKRTRYSSFTCSRDQPWNMSTSIFKQRLSTNAVIAVNVLTQRFLSHWLVSETSSQSTSRLNLSSSNIRLQLTWAHRNSSQHTWYTFTVFASSGFSRIVFKNGGSEGVFLEWSWRLWQQRSFSANLW